MSERERLYETLDVPIEDLAREHPGCVVRDGCIVLDGDYSIALDRCDSPEKVLAWIEQLGERPRFQPLLRRFVLAAAHYNNIEIYYGM
jgi:hypothetical protein